VVAVLAVLAHSFPDPLAEAVTINSSRL